MDAATRYPCPCTAPPFEADSKLWVKIVEKVGSGLPPLSFSRKPSNNLHEPATSPSPSANPDFDPPPSYDAATAPSSTTNMTHPPGFPSSRVAALPVKQPLPNVEYLSILDRSPLPVTFEACGSCYKHAWSSSWRLSRHLICALRNAGSNRSLSLVRRRVRYYDEASRTVRLRFTDGLGAWELNRPARGRKEWTADYPWGLAARHGESKGTWVAEMRLFCLDLPANLQLSIPWRDEREMRRIRPWMAPVYTVGAESRAGGSKYKASWYYFDNAEHPTWCAEVSLCHESLESLLAADNTGPWVYLEPQTCLMAEVDQSTGAGTYKKVMWYHRGIGYGNDLLGYPVAPWHESMMEAYAAFVGPSCLLTEKAEKRETRQRTNHLCWGSSGHQGIRDECRVS